MAISDTATLPLTADGHYAKQAIGTIDIMAPPLMADGYYPKRATGIIDAATPGVLANGHYTKEADDARDTATPSVLANPIEANEMSETTTPLVLTGGHSGCSDGEITKPGKQEEAISARTIENGDLSQPAPELPSVSASLHSGSPDDSVTKSSQQEDIIYSTGGLQKDINGASAPNGTSTPATAPDEHQDTPLLHEEDEKSDVAVKVEASQDKKSDRVVKSEVPQDEAIDRTPPPPKSSKELAGMVMGVLERYRIASRNGISQPYMAYTHFLTMIEERIKLGEIIHMVLPAFPFKSPNRVTKVLGYLPDKAEEVALMHLEGFCKAVEDVYHGGCILEIVSDGISYNDLLGVSDEEVWKYGEAVRQLARDNNCTHIRFARIRDLLGMSSHAEEGKAKYLERVTEYRDQLTRANIPEDFDVSVLIANDPDTAMTYRGYVKFLEKDLEFTDAYERNVSSSQIKKRNERVAKQMIGRGKAFATAISRAFPDSVRLSIHPSAETTKLSISLTPQVGACTMTPWHSTLVRSVDGSIQMSHALRVPALTHELIWEDGRPSYFREKSELFNWPGMDVEFRYMYPCGILIFPRDRGSRYSLHNVHMQKVRKLAEVCSPIVLRGFADTNDRRTFIAKAYDAGEVLPWTFGVLQEVKDAGRNDRMANNVVSSEAMPMHYDGMFKFVKKVDENGNETTVSAPPKFQYFTAKSPSPTGSGYTLFASSRLFFQCLPKPYTAEELSKVTWDCKNSGFWDNHMTNLPLVVPHPTNGMPCVRWHEPWPVWKTKFAHCIINIENASQEIIPLVDSLLYDRRVCLYFTWEKGDVLVSDNFAMLHTRTAFEGDSDRELWRIHFD